MTIEIQVPIMIGDDKMMAATVEYHTDYRDVDVISLTTKETGTLTIEVEDLRDILRFVDSRKVSE